MDKRSMDSVRPFSLLVKPASADCNLRCEYCFYLDKASLYPAVRRHRMSDEVLDRMIGSYMTTEQPCHAIGWQGGEPTIMGVEFFRKVTGLQQKYGRPGSSVSNGLQTNATLIDDEFAAHLAAYNFLCGCSLDGPPEIHNRYRVTARGGPTHADVMRGIETLKRNRVEFNILVLVSQSNVRHAREVYRYIRDLGVLHHQYIPCVEFGADGELEPFAITGDEWGDFLCELFDEWHRVDSLTVSIRHFDSILAKMVDNVSNVCCLGTDCRQYLVVEHNGDIYPCDFFVEPQLKLGNVMDTSWKEALSSDIYREFGVRKSQWNRACETCEWLNLCSADCIRHRVYGGHGPDNLSWLCRGWKKFHGHTRERFQALADVVRARRAGEDLARRREYVRAHGLDKTVGRNDPCPCGSGRKLKKCCGAVAG